MELEVRHLRVISAIAEGGSLTRAAVTLRMTQPGLSAQLRRIEVMLGGIIFERGQSGVVPTPFGEMVLTRARAILPGIDDLLADTVRATRPGGSPDRIRLGSVGAPLLADLVLAVRSVLPAATVSTRGQYSQSPFLDDLATGRLDAAVLGDNPGYELPPQDRVVLRPLVTEPVFALLPAAHPLALQKEVSLHQLLDDDWAMPRPDSDRSREYWATVFASMDRQPRTPYEAEGRQLVEIVRAGLAVSFCQATFIEVPGVAVRPLAGSPVWYRHVLAWHDVGQFAAHCDEIVSRVGAGYLAVCARAPVYARWRERHPDQARPCGAG
ncbi:LysR family transcriptional regulator [Streptacidiphilus pinicola]|uniref:LysR family transcriptional regulator n=2 Tax=Streptacidiphilus pinicola TaxID=2219663 RepID=A0A2X0KGC1_9ACTN|nr:LysR family transcriptional regulator [Streptacidiphilus pinicola]